jgi:hypothetical protein
MKKNFKDLVFLGAIAIGMLVFVHATPVSLADHESCSGINSWSCTTGRPGIVGAGPGGPGGYYVNDPTPGGVCSCSGCWCGSSPQPSVTTTTKPPATGVETAVDVGTVPKTTTGGIGGSPTDRIVTTIKILVNTASTCDSACRAAHNQTEWDQFYTGFYDVPVFNNVTGNTSIGGSVGTGATTNTSCVGMGCNVTSASVTQINPIVDVYYKGIYPIQSLTQPSGSGTKTITQQEFDAKYGSYIQR